MVDQRNFNVTSKMFHILKDIKGFDVAMSNPNAGKLIMQYQGESFVVPVNPIETNGEKTFDEIVTNYHNLFDE